MKATYMFPLGFLGGAIGLQAVKAVLLPLVVWSATAAGGVMYVHWVVASHNANVLHLEASGSDQAFGESRVNQFVYDLSAIVARRDGFISSHRSDDPARFYVSSRFESMRVEDARALAVADQLRTRSPSAYTSDIASKVDQLRAQDAQLSLWRDQVAYQDR